jgi:all-trans-retinol dehydrogenase (NAD+)
LTIIKISRCDVTNREQVLKLGKTILQEVGPVTVLVNNAGIMPCIPLLKTSEDQIRKTFDVNVMAHFWMLEAFLPHMIQEKKGHIVATSSIAGLCGLTNLVPYCSSKFAVRGLMEALHEELREDPRNFNIRTTTVFPYMVDTGLCKKPKIRFPGLLGLINPKTAAESIILAHREDRVEATIPRYLLPLNNHTR